MRVVLVGGGRVGSHLAATLKGMGHAVVVIEADERKATALAEQHDVFTLIGDGSDVRLLDEADTERADLLVAVTGRDEDNLVACQLARTTFGCARVFARLNDPENEQTFTALEVPTVSVTQLMVDVIHRKVDNVATLISEEILPKTKDASLVRVAIDDDAEVRIVSELDLPGDALLVAIERQGHSLLPHGTTRVEPGDVVIALAHPDDADATRARLRGGSG